MKIITMIHFLGSYRFSFNNLVLIYFKFLFTLYEGCLTTVHI